MADATPGPGAPAAVRCRHLRSAGMYVDTAGAGDPDADASSSTCWCLKTMKNFGPDDDRVDREACRDASRPCYEPL